MITGITQPAEQRIKSGNGADPVETATDLGVCAANTSIKIPDSGGVTGSQEYWGKVGGGAGGGLVRNAAMSVLCGCQHIVICGCRSMAVWMARSK